MATVYRARWLDRQIDREDQVAIKIMSSALVGQPSFVERFIREAELVASLKHSHILPLYEHGKYKHFFYLVVRLLEGGTLDDKINGKPMPFGKIERYIAQIAAALDYAHDRKIVHRDLKPTNILLDKEENAYLMDFGIAKVADQSLTMTGQLVGTPSYMPPEQWRGQHIDRRADVYALGMLTFEMFTGRPPFVAQTPHQLMYSHLNEQVPFISQIIFNFPIEVDEVILKATEKEPIKRFPSAGEFALSLARALRQHNARLPAPLEDEETALVHTKKTQPMAPKAEPTGKPSDWMEANGTEHTFVDMDQQDFLSGGRRNRGKDLLSILEQESLEDKKPSKINFKDVLESSRIQSSTEDKPDTLLISEDGSQPISMMERLLSDLEKAPQGTYATLSVRELAQETKRKTDEIPPSDKKADKPKGDLGGLLDAILVGLETSTKRTEVTPTFDSLIKQKHNRGYIGIQTQLVKLQPIMVAQTNYREGLLVIEVEPASPAELEGIFIGDIFVKLANTVLDSRDALSTILNGELVGTTVPLSFIRGGELIESDIFLSRQRGAESVQGK
jgi:serine/threonine protein kinase